MPKSEKVYRGIRLEAGVMVLVDDEPLPAAPSQQIRNHSPDGFEWGYHGSGPAQLALAILLDVTGDAAVAEASYQDFKRQFVADFGDEWELTETRVREWLSLSQTHAG